MAREYWKGSALLAPVPSVMVTCGTVEKSNILTIGWTGVLCTRPPMVYISVRHERHSYNIIKETGEYVINLTPASLVETADYVGTVTGRCVEKAKKCGLELIPSKDVSAPTIADCPLALECRVKNIVPLGTHDMFTAEVVCVSVDDSLLDGEGKLHLDRAGLLVYSHGHYYSIGKHLGAIGISMADRKKGKKAVIRK